jgi:hypothetical protein
LEAELSAPELENGKLPKSREKVACPLTDDPRVRGRCLDVGRYQPTPRRGLRALLPVRLSHGQSTERQIDRGNEPV